jgi:RND family efflux transporter MFP subunit
MSYAREYAPLPAGAANVVHLLDATDESLRDGKADFAAPVVRAAPRPQISALASDKSPSLWRRWLILAALGAVCVSGALVGLKWFRQQGPAPTQPLIFHRVTPGQLPITVTERGNLESQSNIEIICEVDDIDGDGVQGTQIISIVPNGTSVKEGDVLVEFDTVGHQERLDRQILDTESARATQIQAKAKYENQITQNETLLADALLEVELAKLEQEMFVDQLNGTYKLEVETIERLIEDINNEILGAQAVLELKTNEKRGIETLFKLGYAGKHQLDQSQLDLLQSESQYAAKVNKLNTQLATLEKKQKYEKQMEELKLKGKLETADRKVEQVKRNNEAFMAQAKAALDAADQFLEKAEERLIRYRKQIDLCMIKAPQDGMVAYATPDRYYGEEIREGASVRPRQKILSLPNLSKMQVKTSVHESVLDQVKPGLSVGVRVDAFPDRLHPGTVKSVAVLPDQGGYFGSDTKVYQTVITIDEPVERLKPGMTAVAEIHVDRLENVLAVPVQAIVQVGKESSCYVDAPGGMPQRRVVKLGRTNDKLVQILAGVGPGQRVVLNPMAIAEETPKAADAAAEQTESASEQVSETPVRPTPGVGSTEPSRAAVEGATAKAS